MSKLSIFFKLLLKATVVLFALTLITACSDDDKSDDSSSKLTPIAKKDKKQQSDKDKKQQDNNDDSLGQQDPQPDANGICPDAHNPPQVPQQRFRVACITDQQAQKHGFKIYPVNASDQYIPSTVDGVLQDIPVGHYQGHLANTTDSCFLQVEVKSGGDKNFILKLSLPETENSIKADFEFKLRRCNPYKLESASKTGNTILVTTRKTLIKGNMISFCENHLIAEIAPATNKLKHVYLYNEESATAGLRPHLKCVIDKKLN